MSTSTTSVTASTSVYATSAFWERLWRMSGIGFAVFVIIAYIIYGYQPQVQASADALVTFYDGNRTENFDRRGDLRGAAATAASAALGALLFLLITVAAALAYSVAGSGIQAATSGLNDFAWACVVLSSFPRAMLIMASTFGLWRASMISNGLFAMGVAAIVLVLLGGTTWLSGGYWAPDGAYSRYVSPIIGLVWVLIVSRILLTRSPATRTGW